MLRLALAALVVGACAPGVEELPSTLAPGAAGARYGRLHKFRVLATAAPVQIRRDLTLKEVSHLPGAAERGLKTQGVTTIKHSLATHTRFSTTKGGGSVYAWFDDVILEVSVASTVIHIPSEYAPGSCEYAVVLEHERRHGLAAREQAAAFAAKLERALSTSEGLPTRFNPVIAPNFDAAAEVLKAAVAKVVDPVYDRYEKDEKEAQDALDRPDPYDAVYRKCGGWR